MFESWSRWVDGDGGDADALEHDKPGTNSLAEALNELPLWVEATSSPEAAASSSTILLGTNSRAFTSREEVEVDLVEVVVGSSS